MCLSPYAIPNKNFGLKDKGLMALKDCESAYLNIPCGHCLDCCRKKQSALIQRVTMMEETHYIAFCTLTYNPESLPIYEKCVPSRDGEELSIRFPYADVKDLQTLVRNIRQGSCAKPNFDGIPFKYLAVSELGSEKGRPHFHVLFFFPKEYFASLDAFEKWCYVHQFDVLVNWQRNYGARKYPDWRPLCTYKKVFKNGRWNTNYDFHAVVPRNNQKKDNNTQDVAWYVTKYVMKSDQRNIKRQQFLRLNLFNDDYYDCWSTIKCRMLSSKGIGLDDDMLKGNLDTGPISAVILSGINKTLGLNPTPEYPYFIKKDGSTWPLCDYYKRYYMDLRTTLRFRKDLPCGQAKIPDKYLTPEQKFARIHHFSQIKQKLYDKQSLFKGLVPDECIEDFGDCYGVDVECLRQPEFDTDFSAQ